MTKFAEAAEALRQIESLKAQALHLARLLLAFASDPTADGTTAVPAETTTVSAEILATSIDELRISTRARGSLQIDSIKTIGEVMAMSDAELLRVVNFGPISLREVREAIREFIDLKGQSL